MDTRRALGFGGSPEFTGCRPVLGDQGQNVSVAGAASRGRAGGPRNVVQGIDALVQQVEDPRLGRAAAPANDVLCSLRIGLAHRVA